MQLWKYTDDIVVILIIGIWAFEKFISIMQGDSTGVVIEDTYMMLALGYALGKRLPTVKISKEH